jgi:hypothetical protein
MHATWQIRLGVVSDSAPSAPKMSLIVRNCKLNKAYAVASYPHDQNNKVSDIPSQQAGRLDRLQ